MEFCFRKRLQGRDVFWVRGSSDEAFGASYREIARSVNLMHSGEDQGTLLEAVKSWFESPASGNWTIVIDNLDDVELQSGLCIPICRGEILFTTRDERIIGHPGLVPVLAGIEVSRMGEKEATETFYRIVGPEVPVGCTATSQLLTLLDGLPLAIAQAATYIRTTHTPLTQYLARFQESEEHQQALLSKPLPAAQRNTGTDSSGAVMTTWALTVQKIAQESPLSIELLQVMSFLDPDNLPSSFMEAATEALSTEREGHFTLLAPLRNFGLVTRLGSSNYRLHRLVSMWTRAEMTSEVKHRYISQATKLMTGCFPLESCENVTRYTEMLPHALSILHHIGSDGSKFESESSWILRQNVIHFLRGIGQLRLAMEHARLSLEKEKVFEQDESKRYISRRSVGDIYYSMANYASAITEYQVALTGLENLFGKDHPEVLETVRNMGAVFNDNGEHDRALELCQRAHNGLKVALGSDHPKTLRSVNNMAVVLGRKREYAKALEWYQRALDGREKTLGKDHPWTLSTVHDMALVFQTTEEYDKALELYQRALVGQEKALGKDNPDTLKTVHNTAAVFWSKGMYDEALEWYQRALSGQEKTLGKDHPKTFVVINNIGIVFKYKKEYDKALEWYRRALDGQEKALGNDHPDTLMTVYNMAVAFEDKGEKDKALEWYQRALEGSVKALGKDHPRTIRTADFMARLSREIYSMRRAPKRITRMLKPWKTDKRKQA